MRTLQTQTQQPTTQQPTTTKNKEEKTESDQNGASFFISREFILQKVTPENYNSHLFHHLYLGGHKHTSRSAKSSQPVL